jgi:hypothetical protein
MSLINATDTSQPWVILCAYSLAPLHSAPLDAATHALLLTLAQSLWCVVAKTTRQTKSIIENITNHHVSKQDSYCDPMVDNQME